MRASRHLVRPALLVLAKFWEQGPVKTRLAADIGQDRARKIYKELAETFWQGIEDLRWERWLFCEPADYLPEMRSWLPRADQLLPQPPGDLGARLASAFRQAFDSRRPWAAVVGTDAPALDAQRITQAARGLANADVVTQPTEDGGYALLALKEPVPALFQDIEWSTPQVHEATVSRALRLGLTVYSLPPIRDVDTLDDLRALGLD